MAAQELTAPSGSGPPAEPEITERTQQAARWLLVVSLLLPTVLFVTVAWYDRAAVFRDATERVSATTEVLSEQAYQILITAGLVINRTLEHVEGLPPAAIASPRIHDLLRQYHEELPQFEAVFLVDKDGFIAATSRVFPVPRVDVSDREYYARAKAGLNSLVVSAPFRGRLSNNEAFSASRTRLTNGRFDGVAAVIILPDYFRSFYEAALRHGRGAAAALVRRDGAVVVRFPANSTTPSAAALEAFVSHDGSHGVAAANARPDVETVETENGRRLFATIRIPGTELAATYSESVNGVLALWYIHVAGAGTLALIAGAALYLTARVVLRRAELERISFQRLMDETQRRQRAEAAMQQMQKMEALGRLSGGVAHDFNNLLMAVLGSIELALMRVTDERLRRLLGTAQQAAERGARLTAQMLAFSRQHEFLLVPVDVNATIRGMDELLRRSLGALVEIDYALEPAMWRAIADPVQLEVAILNLAVNARDAMVKGGRISIRTSNVVRPRPIDPARAATREFVSVSVADQGSGMAPDTVASAFDPFFTTKEPGKGTGLGLSMVYSFTTQLGGTALIDSALGRGTMVTMLLPRTHRVPAQPEPDMREAKPPSPSAPSRVLVIDDDEDVRVLTCEMLRELGCGVVSASGGRAGIDMLRAGEPVDLLLVDYAMPGLDGVRTAEAAGELRPGLPVAFMTGHADMEALRPWRAAGHTILMKPFHLRDLALAIEAAAGSAARGRRAAS